MLTLTLLRGGFPVAWSTSRDGHIGETGRKCESSVHGWYSWIESLYKIDWLPLG